MTYVIFFDLLKAYSESTKTFGAYSHRIDREQDMTARVVRRLKKYLNKWVICIKITP